MSVYAVDYEPGGLSAAFTGYPTTLLGTNYCLMARPSLANGESQFAIVATADNTTVTIMPSANAYLNGQSITNYASTNAYTVTFEQAGQTYQINSIDDALEDYDVTGTWIKSDKPIAVFAGAYDADVPYIQTSAPNPLVQEQLPVNTWGTLTLGLSFAGRTNGDSYRVLAAYSNTVVTVTGKVITVVASNLPPYTVTASNEVVVVTNQAGQFCDIIVEGPAEFQATQPIQVAQFANGNYFDAPPNTYGDPCELLLPPTGHYLETNIVYTPYYNTNSTGDFDENFLNLIVARSALTNTLVDGAIVATNKFVAIGTSGYYGAQIVMTNSGVHTVTSSQPVEVQVYGFGFCDAYGYFGGWVK